MKLINFKCVIKLNIILFLIIDICGEIKYNEINILLGYVIDMINYNL